MQPYLNRNGNSSVEAYSISNSSITVRFQKGGTYIYDYSSTGSGHVEEMKRLAYQGSGLGSYINKNVRNAYASKVA